MTLLITSLAILLAVTVFRVLHPPQEAKKAPRPVTSAGLGGLDASVDDVHCGNNSTMVLI